MTQSQILKEFKENGIDLWQAVSIPSRHGRWEIKRDRCFLGPVWTPKSPNGTSLTIGARPGARWEELIPKVIHLPGLRGSPERAYAVTAAGPIFSGTFPNYTASVIANWEDENQDALASVNADLRLLHLTGGVAASRPNDAQIELLAGRLPNLPPTRKEDQVNIADVGVGVSQVLPILVALHAAEPSTLVYVEQPETHLHPQAEFVLAQVLAAAAKRGVRVVVETHSTMLLLGVQALVAEGQLDSELVKLHWFKRDKDGRTTVHSGDLDEAGAFGDWPQDFDDVELRSQKRYLDAADKRMFAR
jgi:hypothetical protein